LPFVRSSASVVVYSRVGASCDTTWGFYTNHFHFSETSVSHSLNVPALCILCTAPIAHLRRTRQNVSPRSSHEKSVHLKLFWQVFAVFSSPLWTVLCTFSFFSVSYCSSSFFFLCFSFLQQVSSSLAFCSGVSVKITDFVLFSPLWDDSFHDRAYGHQIEPTRSRHWRFGATELNTIFNKDC